MLWQDGKVQVRRWWNLAERARAVRENLPADPRSWFRETFDEAVKRRLISDVPVGVLLSGGLDSSSIAASLASQAAGNLASFSVRFPERGYDEGLLAKNVAVRYGLAFNELEVRPADLVTLLRQAAWFSNEPLAHGNDLHLLAISRYAKPRVTVLLSGEGADEIMGGYVRYQFLRHPHLLRTVKSVMPKLTSVLGFGSRARKLGRFLELRSLNDMVLFNACDVLPNDLKRLGIGWANRFPYREQILDDARSLYPEDLARQAMYSDQHTFLCSVLDRNDRMTMGASIECRVPFLDYRLVETMAALPSSLFFTARRGKKLLRDALGYRLPFAVLSHRKWGFGVPWREYLRNVEQLRLLLVDLPNAVLLLESPLDRLVVKEKVRAFLNGDDRPFPLLLQLLTTVLAWEEVKVSQS
jgi:asparagine synthase (glutamine-hydrolysing)